MTGGRYFRARDTTEFAQIYSILDELEPAESDERGFRPDHASCSIWPLGAAVVLAFGAALVGFAGDALAVVAGRAGQRGQGAAERMAEFHFLRPWWLAAAAGRRLADLAVAARPRRRRRLAQRRRRALARRTCSPSPKCCATAASRCSRRSLRGSSRSSRSPGPAWERLPVPAFRSDEALVVALDLSRSMDASDVEPSRLARAKLKLLDLLERRAAGRRRSSCSRRTRSP